jgi:hypothetical protein
MTRGRIDVAVILAVALTSSVLAAKLPPRDEARQDPSFLAFRQRLQEAVRKRDRAYLLKVIDPKIRVNFGEGGGAKEFAHQWKLDSNGSLLWKTLEEVLALGGTFSGTGREREFAAPYTYSAFPEKLDAFEHYCVTAPDVPLRAKPDVRARIIARLNYEIVRQATLPRGVKPPGATWLYVATAAGKRGYVARQQVRSPVDYRAFFSKRDGTWRMTALVAGD